MIGYIYGLVGPDGIRYVGQTRQSLARRLHGHKRCAAKGLNTHLYHWMRSLADPVEIVALEQCRIDDLDAREVFWMDRLREDGGRLCNQREGGFGGSHDEETREKLRQHALGKPLSDEAKAKVSAAMTGRYFSPVHRARLCESQRGRKFSRGHLEKLRAARRKRITSPETRAKMSATQKGLMDDARRMRISEGTKAGIARARAQRLAA